ncbi:hypothetical protein ACFWP7_39710 [Streptomyces sp. NPDC058470]|uniref:hypothetical protein n=1 Tax=Streptomyces sp. NPDC058470 TaxID=3346515 RepID=UPI00364A4E55
MASHRLLANGAGTDHPVPGLPFADDTHLPAGPTTPGPARPTRITDPDRPDLMWIIHAHPHLGRTVLLYEAGPDSAGPWHGHTAQPLVTRTGGYWWDGTNWFRPPQLWDAATGAVEQQAVPAAVTVTAADLLQDPRADAGAGQLHQVDDLGTPSDAWQGAPWLHDLARWAAHRATSPDRPPLNRCVLTLTAPELAGDQLIGTPALAAAAAISPSALRAYISRGQGAVPEPQALVGNRPMWSRPVAENWAAHRRRPAADRWPAQRERPVLAAGAEPIRQQLTPVLYAALWEDPERRARWVLRHRTAHAVRQVAEDLAHLAADRLQETVPAQALAEVLTQAAIANFGAGQPRSDGVAQVLGWLTRNHPQLAEQTTATVADHASLQFGTPHDDAVRLLTGAEEARRAAA